MRISPTRPFIVCRLSFLCCFLSVLISGALFAQELTEEQTLSLNRTRFSGEFSAKSFSAQWADSSTYYSQESTADSCGGRDLVKIDPITCEKKILVRASELVPAGGSAPISIASFDFSDREDKLLVFTNTKRVWRRHTKGDYWVLDRSSYQLKQLGATLKPRSLMFAKFSPDGKYVAYVSENNLYAENLISGEIVPLTSDGGERFINGTFDWVYEEELDLRDGFRWSPDSKKIAFWKLDTEHVPVLTLINNTDSFYPTTTTLKYPRTGTTNAAAKVGVIEIEEPKKPVRWIPLPGDARENYVVSLDWLKNENTLFVRQMNRLQNELRYYSVSEKENFQQPHCFRTETDSAWIDLNAVRWLADGRRFMILSDKDGWNHLYLLDWNDPTKQVLLTPGNLDVIDFLRFDRNPDAGNEECGVYFYASEKNATQKYLYRSNLDGSGLKRITPRKQRGTHSYAISRDGKLAFHTYSSFGVPPKSELVRLPEHETLKVYEDNSELREKLAKLPLGKTEFFTVRTEEGIPIDGWCIYPIGFDPEKKYPLLLHVYGEPAGQTVLDSWGGSGYLWNQMFAQKGYVLMSFDNRGTPAPKGRLWRKSAYTKIGTQGPADQAGALRKVLEERPYLDKDRVGIWGWSGGGSMSLHAIFQYPDLYKTAVAIAPVPNERYYDTIYQERYMGLPDANSEAYRESSPITHAKNLKGNLLIVHGTGDDNTHYQTVELLFNELIRNEKQFSMMVYPNRTHGIHEGAGTSKHLWNLVTNYMLRNL